MSSTQKESRRVGKRGIYPGFIARNGQRDIYRGHWHAGWSSFPLDHLPQVAYRR